MPALFDTHFHIEENDDCATIIEEANEAGVKYLAAIAADLDESRRIAPLRSAHQNLFTSIGLHPHSAAEFDGSLEPFEQLLDEFGADAVGEIGLDYFYEYSDRKKQREVFGTFLEFAARTGQPAVIHCRDAYEDCLPILREFAKRLKSFVVHSYTGPVEWLDKFLELGAFISFNGIVTFKRAENVREVLRLTPMNRLLLETDAPYLAPTPFRGKTNRPALMVHTARFIADFLDVDLDELARTTTANAFDFFPTHAR